MVIVWTYGARNQDVQQFGLRVWNWSGDAGAEQVTPAGRLEYTIPFSLLQLSIPQELLQFTVRDS